TPEVNVRAQATVVLVRLPVDFDDFVPFGAAAAERSVRADEGPTSGAGYEARVAETRLSLPTGAGRGKKVQRLLVRASAQTQLTPRDLRLSVRSTQSGAFVPLSAIVGKPDEGSSREVIFTLPAPAAQFIDETTQSIVVRQQFERPSGAPDETQLVGF